MANVKIIDLPTGSPENDSFLEATQVNEQAASGRSSAKIAFNAFANWIAGQGADPVEYGDLNTEDETLIGGINELHNAIGALVDDTTISTVSTWSSKKISNEVDEVYPLGTASGSVAEFETSLVKPFANTRFNVSGNDITSMNIFVRGHNVWDGELEIRDNRLCSKNAIRVLANTTYFFGTSRLYDIYLYDKDMTYLGKPSYTGVTGGYTFNTGANCAYIQFALGGGTTEPDPFPINYPSTDNNYYEYVGEDVSVSWINGIDNGYVDTVNGIVYDTDNDTTESITPIIIKSVNGQNYVWCDTGTSIIGYREALNIPDISVDAIADEYDSTATYTAGDYVMYSGKLYRCNHIGATGTWNPAWWDETSATDYTKFVNTALTTQINNIHDDTADAYSASSTYAVGDLCIAFGRLYRCTTAISTPEAWNSSHWAATTIADEFALKQNATDNSLSTNNKQIVPAINELAAFYTVKNFQGNAPLNINDCVTGYVYWANGIVYQYQNLPSNSAFHIVTFKSISTHGFQIAIPNDGGRIWIRILADGTWSAWKYTGLT